MIDCTIFLEQLETDRSFFDNFEDEQIAQTVDQIHIRFYDLSEEEFIENSKDIQMKFICDRRSSSRPSTSKCKRKATCAP